METRARVGNVESVRCQGICGKCGGEIKSRAPSPGGTSDDSDEDDFGGGTYWKRTMPRGGNEDKWGPEEFGSTREMMGMPMKDLVELPTPIIRHSRRYNEGKKNWGVFSKCKNGCSPVFWGWRWEVMGTLDGGEPECRRGSDGKIRSTTLLPYN